VWRTAKRVVVPVRGWLDMCGVSVEYGLVPGVVHAIFFSAGVDAFHGGRLVFARSGEHWWVLRWKGPRVSRSHKLVVGRPGMRVLCLRHRIAWMERWE